jgi:uncharacterized membrane protein
MSDKITKSIIVKADVDRAFRVWENFENFPHFMEYIETVHKTGPRTSHWEMKGPLGVKVDWDAETTLYEENQRIGWNTKDRKEGNLTTSGLVTFTPLPNNATQVTVILQYEPEGGIAGNIVEKLFANPEKQLEEDLNNFKAYIEGMPERTAME